MIALSLKVEHGTLDAGIVVRLHECEPYPIKIYTINV